MQPWHASLDLHYRHSGERTAVRHRHHGPLRVQKALYPEGPWTCHTLLVHPPGGIAGGDCLEIRVQADRGAHALITTPGAAKWYKSNGRAARQHVRLAVAGALEWLPQEAIVFNEAEVRSGIDLELNSDASMIGWDIVALGRRASGERFDIGSYAQTIRLAAPDGPVWVERTRIAGGDALLDSPIGLAGHHVFGCLWAWGPLWSDDLLDELRTASHATDAGAPLTRLAPRLLVARALGDTTARVRAALEKVWTLLRPEVFAGRPAVAPRIWAT